MSEGTGDAAVEPEIELGATPGDTLRLWLAKEATRQAEVRLNAQAVNIAAMESRATAILAWSVASQVALIAAASQGHLVMIAWIAGACMFTAALFCVVALWPRSWHPPGYGLGALQAMQAQSELAINEAIAAGYETGIEANDARAKQFGNLLRGAWLAFAAAPLFGGAWFAFTGR